MRTSCFFSLTTTFIVCLFIPNILSARTITVPTDASSIQGAIDQAVSGDTVQVMPKAEVYEETLILKEGVILEGLETARTIIDGNGADAVITASNNTTIRNLTITGGITGISVSNISSVTLSNNIIIENSTGIDCLNASLVITQNTIDNNDVNGIFCISNQAVSISNNLISNNGTGINLGNIASVTVSNNGFYGNSENGAEGSAPVKSGDPLFVNPLGNDYHFKNASPTPYRGSDSADPEDDLGAYGGTEADATPFQILGLSTSVSGTDSIDLIFSANQAYNVAGYRIYFNKNKGVHENPDVVDTTICVNDLCRFTITGLDTTLSQPQAPTLQPAITGDQKLFLDWIPPTDQSNISTYNVYWGTTSGDYTAPNSPIDVGNITSYSLLDLVNDTTYFVALSASAQPRFYISVTAIDGASPVNESGFFEDKEVIFTAVPALESLLSNEVQEFPEGVVGFPNLPDEGGCFIATVAYGSHLQAHVKILRAFRDHYLLTNSLGRRFVSFYYHYGPSWAHFIRQDEGLKSLVRLLLLPLVGLSYFMLTTTIIQKVGFLLVLFLFLVLFLKHRRSRQRGLVF